RLPHHHLGDRALLPRGRRDPHGVPGHLAGAGSQRDHHRARHRGHRGACPDHRAGGSADPGAAVRPRRQAQRAGRGDPGRAGRDPGAGGLRHALDARSAGERAEALRRPARGRREHTAERVPAHQQPVAAHRRLAGHPALSRLRPRPGPVRCRGLPLGPHRGLPGEWVVPVVKDMEDEFFLGRRCIAGDDGRLTWLVLASGYRTVHQRSAKALSMFPSTFTAFVKQRVRWSRNSYRCYLTAAFTGWLWRVPAITRLAVLRLLVTPLSMGMTCACLLLGRGALTLVGILARAAWLTLTRGIRGISHLRRRAQESLLLPVVVLVV